MRPRIGISRPGLPLDARVADAVADAGGEPVHLAEPRAPAEALAGLAGLLVPGGPDFAPPRPYPPGVAFDVVPPAQLACERTLVAEAIARGLPVLGLCYGMQLLAVVAGGSLVYDLPTDRPEAGPHRLPEPGGRHTIEIAPGTLLARLLGAGTTAVNSTHHQAVAAPGTGMRVSARAADGIIEAIESADEGRFVLGVQWHPERLDPAHRTALFGPFVTKGRSFSVTSPPEGRP